MDTRLLAHSEVQQSHEREREAEESREKAQGARNCWRNRRSDRCVCITFEPCSPSPALGELEDQGFDLPEPKSATGRRSSTTGATMFTRTELRCLKVLFTIMDRDDSQQISKEELIRCESPCKSQAPNRNSQSVA